MTTLQMQVLRQFRRFSQERPLSPHLTIYQPQLTWILSIFHRLTGAALGTLVFGFGTYSAFNDVKTTDLVNRVNSLPKAAVVGGKTIVAAPLLYHGLNGIRHLIWDSGRMLSLRGVYWSGYTVLGLTAIGTVALVFNKPE